MQPNLVQNMSFKLFILNVLGLHQTPFTPHIKNKTSGKTYKDQISNKKTQKLSN